MLYLAKTPWWLQKYYPECTWQMPVNEKKIYLSFDDGPNTMATPFVLDQLNKYQAKATFFCIGKNVQAHPEIYSKIINEGHAVGNHTQEHLNGWKTSDEVYLDDIQIAGKLISTNLFRPPYGKATKKQLKILTTPPYSLSAVMWTVLSGDFDIKLSKEKCLTNVLHHAKEGSIVVFHDSEKALEKLKYVLPKVLTHFDKKGFQFEKIILQ